MPEANLFKVFTSRLNEAGITYMTTGSVAGIIYGQPCITHGIDLVVELHSEQLPHLLAKFPPEEFYCPPIEVIRLEIERPQRGHFNLIHHQTGFKADVYTAGRDELHEWALGNRNSVEIEGETFWMAPPEYVILRKLEYYGEGGSEKHLRDIAGIIEISSAEVDFKSLKEKIEAMHLEREWQQQRAIKFSCWLP